MYSLDSSVTDSTRQNHGLKSPLPSGLLEEIEKASSNNSRNGEYNEDLPDTTKAADIKSTNQAVSSVPQTPTRVSKRVVAEYNTPFSSSSRALPAGTGMPSTGSTSSATASRLSSGVQQTLPATLRFQNQESQLSQPRSNSLQNVHNYFNNASTLSPSKEDRISSAGSSSHPSRKFQYIYKSDPVSQTLGLPVSLSGSSQSLSQLPPGAISNTNNHPNEVDNVSTKSNSSSFISSSPPQFMNLNYNQTPSGSKYLKLPASVAAEGRNNAHSPSRHRKMASFSIGSNTTSTPLNTMLVGTKLSPPESPYTNSNSRVASFSYLDSEAASPANSLKADNRSSGDIISGPNSSLSKTEKNNGQKDKRIMEKLEALKESITNDLSLKLQKIDYENSILTKQLEQKHLNLQKLNKELGETCTNLRMVLQTLNAKDLSEFKSLEFQKVDDLQTRLNSSKENFQNEKEKLNKFEKDLKLLEEYRQKGQIDKQKQTRIVFASCLVALASFIIYRFIKYFAHL